MPRPLIPSARLRRLVPMLGLPVLSLLPVTLQGQGSGDDAMAVLEQAAERYREVEAVCADFTQTLEVVLLRRVNSGSGVLCQKAPNLFSMRFSDPGGDAVVADGEFFWVYYRSINPEQVLKLPLDPERGGMDFYREFLQQPREKYDARIEGREEVTGRETVRIGLEPLMPRGYESAKVWIDPAAGTIRRIRVVEDNGTVRTVTLSGIRMDPEVDAGIFSFQVPEGVIIVSR